MRIPLLAVVIGAGLLSRAGHSGSILIDKYLGDALYAVMIYLLLPVSDISKRMSVAMGIMGVIELFQTTGIPAQMVQSGTLPWRLAGRLWGTVFGWADLVAYAVGIGTIGAWDRYQIHFRKGLKGHPEREHRVD